MTTKQEEIIAEFRQKIKELGYQIASEKEINYGLQIKLPDGSLFTVYTSGKVVFGGKGTPLQEQLKSWHQEQQLIAQSSALPETPDNSSRATRFIVAASKFDKIRQVLASLPDEIIWREQDDTGNQVYRAEIRRDADRVVATQYKTETLLVQGRASTLFDEICSLLDANLVQAKADRATRFLPSDHAKETLAEMNRPGAEQDAWDWLNTHVDQNTFDFLEKHDQDTLVAGAMLFQAAQALSLSMPDYSPLVMPFARAYEGFLIKLFTHIGWVDAAAIQQDSNQILVGSWLNDLPKHIVDTKRHRYIATKLQSAWEGTRHLMIHSDPTRQTKVSSQTEAEHEICGALLQAIKLGYTNFVGDPIALKPRGATKKQDPTKKTNTPKPQQNQDVVTINGVDEIVLIQRLEANGFSIDYAQNPNAPFKWRVMTADWNIFFAKEPPGSLTVRGPNRELFLEWYQETRKTDTHISKAYLPHIGADEAGKGDYFGPLVVAAVYVDGQTAVELAKWGVKDSKSMSDHRILELAQKVKEQCAHVIKPLMPAEYNQEYDKEKNLNRLLATLHAQAIIELVEDTKCYDVLVDQFAAEDVMVAALKQSQKTIQLVQRTQGESDIAVAAASILARAAFVNAMEDLSTRSGMEIPFGSSAPEVITVGKQIYQRWGEAGLRRIAKINFKTTKKITEGT